MDQGEFGDDKAKREEKQLSWLSRRSACAQFFIIFVPMICLLTAVIVLTVFLDQEIRKQNSKPVVIPTQPPPVAVETTTKNVPEIPTTTVAGSPKVCSTEKCVAAAGSIISSLDRSVNPCDDFYKFVCTGYERNENIPAGYSRYSTFDKVRNTVVKRLRIVLETLPAPENEPESHAKARRFYSACLNFSTVAELAVTGKATLKRIVNDLGGFARHTNLPSAADWSLVKILEKRNQYSINGLFSFGVGEDDKNVQVSMFQLSQNGALGLGTGSRDSYLNKDVTKDPTLVAYTDLLARYANLLIDDGSGNGFDRKLATDVVTLEKEIANIQLTNSAMRDVMGNYNKQTIGWLRWNAGFIDWRLFLESAYKTFVPGNFKLDDSEPVLIYGTSYLLNLAKLIATYSRTPEGKRTLQNYVIFRTIAEYAPKVGGEFQAANERFQAVYSGRKGSLALWEICSGETDRNVPFPLGAMYVSKYFPESAKNQARFVVDSLLKSFRQRVVNIDWMDEATKQKAIAKVDALTFGVAYPDWIEDHAYLTEYYAPLQVTENYIDNVLNAYWFRNNKEFSTLRPGRDTKMWHAAPQTTNAFYTSTLNMFLILAGLMEPPFFFKTSDIPLAINFAGTGVVTGHEISHGFDDKGSLFDAVGNMASWWSEETRKTFDEKAQCLVDQYAAFEAEGLHLDGHLTLGENIADNGGVRSGFDAYKAALTNHDESIFVGLNFTSDQLFFVGYAQIWCSLHTPQSLRNQILQDPHSPSQARVNIPLSNSPDFAAAFNCPLGSPMNPTKKCSVW